MSAPEVAFSELQQHAGTTVAKLEDNRSIRLRRRDAEDLMLTTASRAEADSEALSATTSMFIALMQRDATARSLLVDVVPEAFPWLRFLPREDVQAFVLELVDTLRAADSVRNAAPIAQVVTDWRHTAEIWADPELLARLQSPVTDAGTVDEPVTE